MSSNIVLAAPEWCGAPGAKDEDIAALRSELPFEPPAEYLDLLRVSNGGEGELALPPLWLQLFDISFALQLWSDTHYRKEYPMLFFFGSNGGFESIAVDMSRPKPWPVVMVDCVAGIESSEVISQSMASFIQAIGRRC